MKGWGAQDDFQEQIDANNNDAIERARINLQGQGSAYCVEEDCGVFIPEERRAAIPSTRRCIKCQIRFELYRQ